jgi:nucleoside-diphosphate-sugar epimerase
VTLLSLIAAISLAAPKPAPVPPPSDEAVVGRLLDKAQKAGKAKDRKGFSDCLTSSSRSLFGRVFPDVTVERVPRPPDLRDYFVSCARIREELGYSVKRTPEDGLREIADALAAGAFADPSDKRYRNA